MRKADSFIQPIEFTGTYPHPWTGYIHLQPRTPEGRSDLKHLGVDYNYGSGDQDLGIDIWCVANGWVETVLKWDRKSIGFGNHCFVKHELNAVLKKKYGIEVIYSHYAHLDDIVVRQGQDINKGDLIGYLGKSGTKWAHLHLEIRKPTRLGYESYPSDKPLTWINEYYFDTYKFIGENRKVTDVQPSGREALEVCMKDREKFWQERDQARKQLEETIDELLGSRRTIEEYDKGMMQISSILKSSKELPDILGKITELVRVEDRLAETEKNLKDCQENHGQKIIEWGGAIGVQVDTETAILEALQRFVGEAKLVKEENTALKKILQETGEENKQLKARRTLDKFTRWEILKELLKKIFKK